MNPRRDNAAIPVSRLLIGFPSKGFIPIPPDLIDWVFPILSEAELRVLLYIVRRTYGFGKQSDKISLTQFCAGPTSRSGVALDLGTGLSRQGVLNGITGLQEKGLLKFIAGNGRSQVSTFEIDLSPQARSRIETLKIVPREMVNTVDRCQKQRKGQRPVDQRVNPTHESHVKGVNAVDPQKKEYIQQRVRQEIGLTSPDFSSLNPIQNRGNAENLELKLEKITGQGLTSSERRKLQAISDYERVAEVLDTFSTETHWVDSPKKNAAFFDYFQRAATERWKEED